MQHAAELGRAVMQECLRHNEVRPSHQKWRSGKEDAFFYCVVGGVAKTCSVVDSLSWEQTMSGALLCSSGKKPELQRIASDVVCSQDEPSTTLKVMAKAAHNTVRKCSLFPLPQHAQKVGKAKPKDVPMLAAGINRTGCLRILQ